MEKVFTQEIIRMIGILGLASFSLMAIAGRFISKLRGGVQPYLKSSLLYLLVCVLLFAIIAFTGYTEVFKRPGLVYIIVQLLCIGIGYLHVKYLNHFVKWTGPPKLFWVEVLFTIIICLFGFMAFTIVFKWMNREGYHYLMASSVFWMLIVQFVYHTFKKAIAIPVKVFNQWYYPLHKHVEDPDEDKMKHLLVISFMFQKKTTDDYYTNFRAKAPVDMEFGQLFYFFINDYNERHPNAKIQYVNDIGQPHGWTFYRKLKWYEFSTNYIDDRKTFFANRIRENDVIVCTRI
jgi:hypothetical protein